MQEHCIQYFKKHIFDICLNRHTKAILTNIQTYVLLKSKNETRPFLDIILLIKILYSNRFILMADILEHKCCRCNKGSLLMNIQTFGG